MTAAGRPLRALAMLMFGWTACRMAIAVPWAADQPSAWAADRQLYQRLTFAIPMGDPEQIPGNVIAAKSKHFAARQRSAFRTPIIDVAMNDQGDPGRGILGRVPDSGNYIETASAEAGAGPASILGSGQSNALSRWSLDAWLLARNGSSRPALASYGQLGGSQAGLRVQYDLTPGSSARLAAYARISSALAYPAAPEAALGIGYRPIRSIPFDIGIERRIALGNGARNAFAVVAATGFGPTVIPFGLEGEGYAQGGFVGLRSYDAFADGKLSIRKNVFDDRFSIGFSTSGGAQRNLTRLDIGPQVQMRFSTGRIQSRMAAEWRQRVTGRAQPGSGPAITLVAGF